MAGKMMSFQQFYVKCRLVHEATRAGHLAAAAAHARQFRARRQRRTACAPAGTAGGTPSGKRPVPLGRGRLGQEPSAARLRRARTAVDDVETLDEASQIALFNAINEARQSGGDGARGRQRAARAAAAARGPQVAARLGPGLPGEAADRRRARRVPARRGRAPRHARAPTR